MQKMFLYEKPVFVCSSLDPWTERNLRTADTPLQMITLITLSILCCIFLGSFWKHSVIDMPDTEHCMELWKMLTHPAGSTTGSNIAWIWTGKVQVLTDYSNQNCLVFIEEKKMILCCLKVKTLLSMAYAINRIKCSYVVPISVLKCQVHLSGDNSMQTRHPS